VYAEDEDRSDLEPTCIGRGRKDLELSSLGKDAEEILLEGLFGGILKISSSESVLVFAKLGEQAT
jgi:hypothetical protein